MTVLVIVALLAEGVDRNQYGWFERLFQYGVALLAEGVDRNRANFQGDPKAEVSPSSRRAWIEISRCRAAAA